jgi:ribosomal protein S18 acetylase RimI-like enzyme
MSPYSQYLKEREGLETLETLHGFALYKIQQDECYIQDIYVLPDKRRSGVASQMADAVAERAKSKGCRWLVGSVSPAANNAHTSLMVLIHYGMKLQKADKDIIFFAKEI